MSGEEKKLGFAIVATQMVRMGRKGMGNYYVDKNVGRNGEHEVHEAGCLHMPDVNDKEYLGSFPNCADAVIMAKKTYPAADGCGHCSNECYAK